MLLYTVHAPAIVQLHSSPSLVTDIEQCDLAHQQSSCMSTSQLMQLYRAVSRLAVLLQNKHSAQCEDMHVQTGVPLPAGKWG